LAEITAVVHGFLSPLVMLPLLAPHSPDLVSYPGTTGTGFHTGFFSRGGDVCVR